MREAIADKDELETGVLMMQATDDVESDGVEMEDDNDRCRNKSKKG